MQGLFGLLLFASIICLVVGLANPKAFVKMLGEQVNRKKIIYVFGISIIACFILIGAFGGSSGAKTAVQSIPTQQEVKTTANEDQQKIDEAAAAAKKAEEEAAAKATVAAPAPTTTAPAVTTTPKTTTPSTVAAPSTSTSPSTSTDSGDGYTNVDGNHVASPSSNPAGATAKCRDGNYSYSQHRSGTCSGHGGVAEWL